LKSALTRGGGCMSLYRFIPFLYVLFFCVCFAFKEYKDRSSGVTRELSEDDVALIDTTSQSDIHLDHLSHYHKHKDIFPLDSSDYIGTVLIVICLMIAASGGIGGGGIIMPLLILVFGFTPKMAIPLSNFTILGSSLTNLIMNMPKRHPSADRPLVDWNLILIMEPLTVGGAIIGAFLSKVLPDIVLTVMLVVVLAFTSHRTLEKGIKEFKKESEAYKVAQRSALSKARDELDEEDNEAASEQLLAKEKTAVVKTDASKEQSRAPVDIESKAAEDLDAAQLADILEQERSTPKDKVLLLIVMFIVLITLNLLKGGGPSFPSPLGIECGGFYFWLLTFSIFAWVLGIAFYIRTQLVSMWRLKRKLRYKYVEGDVEWNERNTLVYPSLCIFAGFCAGMFGIGGGIIKGPLMLEMGVHPMVAASSVAVMIFMTAIAATTSFVAFGTLTFDYAFYLFGFGLTATVVGQLGVGYLVKKYNRMSLIQLSIGAVIALSTLLMSFQSVLSLFGDDNEDSNKLCS